MRIGVISDTHGFLDPRLLELLADVDEVWHAGDLGEGVLQQLQNFKPLRTVWGNADSQETRHDIDRLNTQNNSFLPAGMIRFVADGADVLMTHIGGYPGKYAKNVSAIMRSNPPHIFVAGHSHILKVMFDQKHNCLHINPGACGHFGFHTIRTAITFEINSGVPENMQVIEFGPK